MRVSKTTLAAWQAWMERNPVRRWLNNYASRGLAYNRLQTELGITRQLVWFWERGKVQAGKEPREVVPPLDVLCRIEDVTGIPLAAWGQWMRAKPAPLWANGMAPQPEPPESAALVKEAQGESCQQSIS